MATKEAIIVSKVKLLGRKLLLEGTNEVAYQHSSDLFIELSLADGIASPFYEMLLTATVKTPDKDVVSCPIIEESGKKYIQLTGEALSMDGYVKLSVGGINDDRIVITSNTIDLCVDESNNVVTRTSPNEKYWQIEVRNAIRYWYDTQIKPQYEALKDTVTALIERDEELQDEITKTEEVVNNTLSEVNGAIEQSAAAAQNANTAASAANDAAQAASMAVDEANTAASNASSAAQNANNIAAEVERRLNAGEFVGETGPVGATGATGPVGAKGDKGEPGSRILYGSGAPSSSIGNVGDWYYDTGSELWDVFYKATESTWTKMGQLKSNAPTSLIINGDFQINQRGQSEYTSNGYSLDMWYFRNYNQLNTKLEPNTSGIRMTNNGASEIAVYQYVYAVKQVVTLVAKVNGKIYSISGLPTGTGATPTIVVEEGKIELNVRYYDTDKRYRVYAMVGANQFADIEYIDLFEGDITYRHQKENKAIALWKCQDYHIVVKFNEWSHIPFTNSLANAYVKIPLPKTFDFSNKTTNLGKLKECTVLGDNSIGIESISVQSSYEKNNILELYIKLTKSISTQTGAFETKGNTIVISISREPL